MNDLQMMTPHEIAKETGIELRKVRSLVQSGFFPRVAIPGRKVLVLRADVVAAMTGHRTGSRQTSAGGAA